MNNDNVVHDYIPLLLCLNHCQLKFVAMKITVYIIPLVK